MLCIINCYSHLFKERPDWSQTHPNGSLILELAMLNLRDYQGAEKFIVILNDNEFSRDVRWDLLSESVNVQINPYFIDCAGKQSYLNVLADFFWGDAEDDFVCICPGNCLFEFDSATAARTVETNTIFIIKTPQTGEVKIELDEFDSPATFMMPMEYEDVFSGIVILDRRTQLGVNLMDSSIESIHGDHAINVANSLIGSNTLLGVNCEKLKSYAQFRGPESFANYKRKFNTIFCDLDGVVFYNSSKYFSPTWKESVLIEPNAAYLRTLSESDFIELIFITARPESVRAETEAALKSAGIKFKSLLMSFNHAKRVIVNDFSNRQRKSCEAINIVRNSHDLEKCLGSVL